MLLCPLLRAQQYATILYRQSELPHAVPVDEIDSVVVRDVAQVDATYFQSAKDTVYVAQKRESHWKGKRVGFLGDSITQNAEYVNSYGSLTGCTVMNYGISATHMASRNSSDSNAFDRRYSKISKTVDMVVVFGGTNDFGHASTAEFGAFTDGPKVGKYTFYAGLHRLFKGLHDRYEKWIAEYKGRVLTIETDDLDFESRPEDFAVITDKIDAELYGLFPIDNNI